MTGAAEGGFTLLELLVVLAVLALAAAIVGPTTRSSDGVALRAGGAALVDRLARAREAAIADGRTRCLAFAAAPGCAAVALPAGVSIASRPAPIRFYADGSSSGARLVLAAGSARRALSVVGATGQILLR